MELDTLLAQLAKNEAALKEFIEWHGPLNKRGNPVTKDLSIPVEVADDLRRLGRTLEDEKRQPMPAALHDCVVDSADPKAVPSLMAMGQALGIDKVTWNHDKILTLHNGKNAWELWGAGANPEDRLYWGEKDKP